MARCHYCSQPGNRFKVANAYLWCGLCPLPKPEPARLAMFPNEGEAAQITANGVVVQNPNECEGNPYTANPEG